MREIKFRSWNGREFVLMTVGELIDGYGSDCYFEKFMEPDNIEQYTGLKDKNGKKIYEGDILCPKGYHCPSEIVFNDGSFRKKYVSWDSSLQMPIINKTEIKLMRLKIIGNIHENPEILS